MTSTSSSPKPSKAIQRIVGEQGCHHGNACTDAQFSWHIRAFSDTSCNGFNFLPGSLRESDLKPFSRYIEATELAARVTTRPTVLYVWRRVRRHDDPMVYGVTLTDYNGRILGRTIRRGARAGIATVRFLERAAGLKRAA